jgi:hypothetical protein
MLQLSVGDPVQPEPTALFETQIDLERRAIEPPVLRIAVQRAVDIDEERVGVDRQVAHVEEAMDVSSEKQSAPDVVSPFLCVAV